MAVKKTLVSKISCLAVSIQRVHAPGILHHGMARGICNGPAVALARIESAARTCPLEPTRGSGCFADPEIPFTYQVPLDRSRGGWYRLRGLRYLSGLFP